MDQEKTQPHLETLVKAMAACSPEELCAAIAMLPDYLPSGEIVVLTAAARVIVDGYTEKDEKTVLSQLKDIIALVRRNKTESDQCKR